MKLRVKFNPTKLPFFPLNLRWCSYLGKGNPKSVSDMLIDSAVIGGIAVFAAISTLPCPTIEVALEYAWIGVKAFGAAFLMQLAAERRIKTAKKDIV